MTNTSTKLADNDDWEVLWLLRLLFMTYFMAVGTLQPFMAVYYHSLGYDGNIIGTLGAISPLTTFLVAPIWGMISDRTKSPFLVLCTTAALTLIGQLLVPLFCRSYRSTMVVVCLTAICSAPVKPLIDSLAIGHLHDRSQFGKLRLWSLIGTGIASSVAGRFLNDVNTTTPDDASEIDWDKTFLQNSVIFWRNLSGYNLIFFAYAVLHIPAFLSIWLVRKVHNQSNGKKDDNGDNESITKNTMPVTESIGLIFRQKGAATFFFLVFSLGMSAGLGDNFAYVRFREVGGTGTNMGMSRLLCSLAGSVMFWYSGKLGSWLGMERVMVFSLLSMATRFSLFAAMDAPWYGYIAEMIRGMTFGCFWSTATVYASQLAPQEVQATTLQLLSGGYNGIGRSAGALIGGKLQAHVGTTAMFKYCSTWNYVLAALFVACSEFNLLQPRKKIRPLVGDVNFDKKGS